MDKEKVLYAYNGILLIHKKKEMFPFVMPEVTLREFAEWNKSEKDIYRMISLIYGILKNKANAQTKLMNIKNKSGRTEFQCKMNRSQGCTVW